MDGKRLTIFRLERGSYVECEASDALPLLTAGNLTSLVAEAGSMDSVPWLRNLRTWVRQQSKA